MTLGPGIEVFAFLNSPVWLEYTQKRYLTVDEIAYRLKQQKSLPADWDEISKKITEYRKIGSVPLVLNVTGESFWFFPSDSLTKKVREIDRIGTELLSQITRQRDFSRDFFLDATIEEAITSAIYEGAHSTRAEAQQLIASGNRPTNKDEWMLYNNFRAMNWIQESRHKSITEPLILELHRIVTENTMEGDDASSSGRLRNDRVFVGPHEGLPHGKLSRAIEECIDLVTKNPRDLHPMIKGILLHYFTAYIHPFFDGNGRTARALFYFKGMRNELEYMKLLSVSAYLKEHGRQYENSFEKVVANELDVTYFIDFCLDSIHSALLSVSKKVTFLLSINRLVQPLGLSTNQIGLLQRMVLHKFRSVSIEEHAAQISKSREVARQELKTLAAKGLVHEAKSGMKFVYRIDRERLERELELHG